MKAELGKQRASKGEAQRAVLELLRTQGPMQRWQIDAALGKHCDGAVMRLLKAGCVEKYQDDNRDPDPCSNKMPRYQAEYIAFVRDLDKPERKGVSDGTLRWAARVLRAAGWTVEPPNVG